jgi:sRNA-binding carbon storage regulator CsrA
MLVLSRGLNEGVVLGDWVVVTLVRLLPASAALIIGPAAGGPGVLMEVRLGEPLDVGRGARVTLLQVLEASGCGAKSYGGPKARLGFVVPPTVSVRRKEVWETAGGRGPDGYFPGTGAGPSRN